MKNIWKIYKLKIKKISNFYETPSYHNQKLPKFLNIGLLADFKSNEIELLDKIRSIEKKLGRNKAKKNDPRINEIDIIDFKNIVKKTNDLISSDIASITPAIGIEIGYIDLVYLRIGAGNFQNEIQYDSTEKLSFQPNFGIGVSLWSFKLDYSLTNIGNSSTVLHSNIFSFKYNF